MELWGKSGLRCILYLTFICIRECPDSKEHSFDKEMGIKRSRRNITFMKNNLTSIHVEGRCTYRCETFCQKIRKEAVAPCIAIFLSRMESIPDKFHGMIMQTCKGFISTTSREAIYPEATSHFQKENIDSANSAVGISTIRSLSLGAKPGTIGEKSYPSDSVGRITATDHISLDVNPMFPVALTTNQPVSTKANSDSIKQTYTRLTQTVDSNARSSSAQHVSQSINANVSHRQSSKSELASSLKPSDPTKVMSRSHGNAHKTHYQKGSSSAKYSKYSKEKTRVNKRNYHSNEDKANLSLKPSGSTKVISRSRESKHVYPQRKFGLTTTFQSHSKRKTYVKSHRRSTKAKAYPSLKPNDSREVASGIPSNSTICSKGKWAGTRCHDHSKAKYGSKKPYRGASKRKHSSSIISNGSLTLKQRGIKERRITPKSKELKNEQKLRNSLQSPQPKSRTSPKIRGVYPHRNKVANGRHYGGYGSQGRKAGSMKTTHVPTRSQGRKAVQRKMQLGTDVDRIRVSTGSRGRKAGSTKMQHRTHIKRAHASTGSRKRKAGSTKVRHTVNPISRGGVAKLKDSFPCKQDSDCHIFSNSYCKKKKKKKKKKNICACAVGFDKDKDQGVCRDIRECTQLRDDFSGFKHKYLTIPPAKRLKLSRNECRTACIKEKAFSCNSVDYNSFLKRDTCNLYKETWYEVGSKYRRSDGSKFRGFYQRHCKVFK